MAKLKSIEEVLTSLEDGDLARELSTELQKAACYLKEHAAERGKGGKASGKLALTLGIDVQGSSVTFNADYAVTLPKKPRALTSLFVSNKGEILTGHPKQEEFRLGDRNLAVEDD